jgi:hypothetical protein
LAPTLLFKRQNGKNPGKMFDVKKKHALPIVVVLIALFVMGPPVAFSNKLPTVCNIFSQKAAEKGGSCGHRAILSNMQDKSVEIEAVLFFPVDFAFRHSGILPSQPLPASVPSGNEDRPNPLRC